MHILQRMIDVYKRQPAVTRVRERETTFEIDQAALERLVAEVSAVFTEYKDIYNSSVAISGAEIDLYRLTSEGVQLKEPGGQVTLLSLIHI